LEGLQRAGPATAQRFVDFPGARAMDTVPAGALVPGDVVLVPPGQAVPADGVILEGDTEVDLALLTGESRTRALGPGAPLPGGAVNVAQAIVVR
ncbi:heavy metal translocating P-type ATPase, partial [Telluria sp. Tellsp99]